MVSTPKLIILAGISGSGKSTYAKTLLDDRTCVVCPDAIRETLTGREGNMTRDAEVWNVMVPQLVADGLKRGNVIFDATQVTVAARAHSIARGRSAGARVECHYVKPNLSQALERNRQRDRQVPESVIGSQLARWVLPVEAEGFDLVKEILI